MQESAEGSPAGVTLVQAAPHTVLGILSRLGPGLIIAAAIVGSGELIATTKTGAEAGFSLLWLIIIGCVIKVFTQVEFGRYTIVSGHTSMTGMNEVPGPRLRVNWLVWYWLAMFLFSLGQLGGIVGGVGQALAISAPLTGDFNRLLDEQLEWDGSAKLLREDLRATFAVELGDAATAADARKTIESQIRQRLGARPDGSRDDKYWAAIITVATAIMLAVGRYGFIQAAATFMVAIFTGVTVVNLFALQSHPEWAVSWENLKQGLSFQLPKIEPGSGSTPLATALATFGIIGVGATELIAYPYWCLEKGYARFTGPRNDSPQWAERARGWMNVMRWDAWCSMVVYTFATIAFYLLGATVLNRAGKNPEGSHMIRTLGDMYAPVFGSWAESLFLFGAFAVLYSTFFVAIASHARTCADAVYLFKSGRSAETPEEFRFWTKFFCALFPFVSLLLYVVVQAPAKMVLASGVMQAIMLPMLGGAALYFRFRRCDRRLEPGKLWDLMLWISVAGLLIAGGWTALTQLFPQLKSWA